MHPHVKLSWTLPGLGSRVEAFKPRLLPPPPTIIRLLSALVHKFGACALYASNHFWVASDATPSMSISPGSVLLSLPGNTDTLGVAPDAAQKCILGGLASHMHIGRSCITSSWHQASWVAVLDTTQKLPKPIQFRQVFWLEFSSGFVLKAAWLMNRESNQALKVCAHP